eukprot:jgi/Chlat1/3014/Chrsp201S03266
MPRNPKKSSGPVKKKKKPKSSNGVDSMDTAGPSERPRVWQPGVDAMADDEALEFDPTAYDCLHAFRLEWPCLSFDLVRDSLGAQRTQFPHTIFAVTGTQADRAVNNTLAVLRLSNITRMRHPKRGDEEEESESDDSDNEEPADGSGPQLQARLIAHHGGVNRARSMGQKPHIVATWADTGHVQVWDVSRHLQSLAEQPATAGNAEDATPTVSRQAPVQVFTGHTDEGFAMDWSPVAEGRLLTGDCKNAIYLWEPQANGKWTIDKTPFKGHTASVEDLQWSPTEESVFASCSVDHTLKIWDARQRQQAVLSVTAHDADVNVISWNRIASCMLASGADDGCLRIWDLRNFKDNEFVAHFKYNKEAISSVEWSPAESSVVATTSSDNQLCVWDLSVERDAEEEASVVQEAATAGQTPAVAPSDLPAQLLFVHQGQTDLKELHWHPQLPGFIVSTAADGFNIFKASNC